MPTWRDIRGAYGRGRRALRRALLEPVLVGWPVLREVVMNALAAQDIEARPVWKPMHLQPLWRGAEQLGGSVAAELFAMGICLPSSSSLTPAEQDRVVAIIHGQCRARVAR